jgi:hypothetical protein
MEGGELEGFSFVEIERVLSSGTEHQRPVRPHLRRYCLTPPSSLFLFRTPETGVRVEAREARRLAGSCFRPRPYGFKGL